VCPYRPAGCAALKFLAEEKKDVQVRGVVRKKTSMAAMKKDFPSDSITVSRWP